MLHYWWRDAGCDTEFFPDPVWKAPKFGVHFMTPVLDDGLYGFDGRHDFTG